jgi:hypothetical protein
MNGLAGGENPWRRLKGYGRTVIAIRRNIARHELRSNVKRGAGVERRNVFRRGETSGGKNPRSATGTKQGRKGKGRKKALRGRENLRAQHSRVRQTRCRSLPLSKALKGCETSGEPALQSGGDLWETT